MSEPIDEATFERVRGELLEVLERNCIPCDQGCTMLLMLAAGVYAQLDADEAGFADTARIALETILHGAPSET